MFRSVIQTRDALSQGRVVAVRDDCAPVPSMCLVQDAKNIQAQDLNFLIAQSRGVVCAAISDEHRRALGLPLMARLFEEKGNSPRALLPSEYDSRSFDLTVSVEARHGVSTGISAEDRARTLRALATTKEPTRDLVTPGHIFPARTLSGGVLVKASPAEAASDLLSMARAQIQDTSPAVAVFSQCLSEFGSFLTPEQEEKFLKIHAIPCTTVSEVIRYRLVHERLVTRVAEAKLPIEIAPEFRAVCYHSKVDQAEHLALVLGSSEDFQTSPGTHVRVQAERPFQDILGFTPGVGLDGLRRALSEIRKRGKGVLLYIRHPDRTLLERREKKQNGNPRALRELGIGSQILVDLGIRKVVILSNSNTDFSGLGAFQIEVVGQEAF